MLNKEKSRLLPGKTKLFAVIFFTVSLLPGLLFAQFTQQGPKLVGAGAVGSQVYQGCSVSISSDGNTAIVGGFGDNGSSGAVWVFTRSGGVWIQQGSKLVGTGGGGSTGQGNSVAISSDGNTAITGGPGLTGINTGGVWIFTRTGGVWTQQGPELVGAGAVGASNQGLSVAISSDGNTAVVGGCNDSSHAGAIWVYTRSGGVWSEQGPKLVGTNAVGSMVYQGISVSISSDGNTLIEGGSWDNLEEGAVWVFTRSGGVWTQQGSKLVGAGAIGSIVYQGSSVSISSDGNTFVEGGFYDNSSQGAIWVFTRSGGVWTQQGLKLVGSGGIGNYVWQGYSVAISPDGNTAVESGYSDDTSKGAVWVFHRNGGVWTQLGPKFVGSNSIGNASQGYSVAISSEGTVIEGGFSDNNYLGAAWVFSDPTIGVKPISQRAPESYSLSQNYPNPFNPNTKIKFQIAGSSDTKLIIFDALGREVSTLVNERLNPGTYEVGFDGSAYASGIYFYVLKTETFTETKKMLMVK